MARVHTPPAARALDRRGVPFELLPFDAAIHDAAAVAAALGEPPDRVYKTLVIEQVPPARLPWLVMVPAGEEADLKALAAGLGVKKVTMASHRDAERHTGLRVGGISALALLDRRFPTAIDARALAHPTILVSAGERGYDLRIAVDDLIALTGARVVPLR